MFGAFREAQGEKAAADWKDVRTMLTDSVDDRFTQGIGGAMRKAGVEAFQFISASAVKAGIRNLDPDSTFDGIRNFSTDSVGINWGLFTPRAFQETIQGCDSGLRRYSYPTLHQNSRTAAHDSFGG